MNYTFFNVRGGRGDNHNRVGRRRGSHSPPKEMEVEGAGRVTRGGARDAAGDGRAREKTDHQFHGRQLEGRRHPGRELDSNVKNDGHGRGPRDAESDDMTDRQRLFESLIDPQEVPRSGYYFEVRLREGGVFHNIMALTWPFIAR